MATAFQPSAFQNNAFQIDEVVVEQPAPDAGAGGAGGLGGVRRPRYSGHLWRALRAARRRALDCALEESRRRREALELAAAAVAEALRGEELTEASREVALMANALNAACRAKTVNETVRLVNEVLALAARVVEDEPERIIQSEQRRAETLQARRLIYDETGRLIIELREIEQEDEEALIMALLD